jgi:hypothetical protein
MAVREGDIFFEKWRGTSSKVEEVFGQKIPTILEESPMPASSIGSRLKAQLTKYALAVSEGLSRPQRKFVQQMLYGIQATQDVKLSSIARSLQENIALIKTEDRLSRNLGAEALDVHLLQRLAEMGSRRVGAPTVLCLDLSDVRKE